ncbi:MAG: transporter substrate-binding domain-containing protein [Magnetococcales bacterium]|nr:transporter substrate-binding domain-containing protein [Magnetococcales bacterium]
MASLFSRRIIIAAVISVLVFTFLMRPALLYAQEPITQVKLALNEFRIGDNKFTDKMYSFALNIFRSQGIDVTSVTKPFLRATQELDKGLVDGHAGTFASKWKGYIYPRWHYHVSNMSALFIRDKNNTWKGYESLSGKRIGWPKGYFLHVFFDKNVPIQLLEIVDMKQCIRLLIADRLDYCIEGLITGLQPAMYEMELNLDEFQTETVFLEPAYIRFLDTPRSRQLINIFDKQMDRLYQSGELEKIYNKLGLPIIYPEQSALAKRPTVILEQVVNGTDEWAKFVTYLNH